MDNYTLGIIWSIGSFQDNRFIFRHRNKYFLEQIQKYCNNNIYVQQGRTDIQYVLKTTSFTPSDFEGWTERNSEQRNIPILDDYKDFLRVYFEIHSCLDYCTAYSNYGRKNQKKYYKLRLRIYGNYILIQSINNILKQECKVNNKKVQHVNINDKTTYLQYTFSKELTIIFNWLTGEPYCKKYWQDIDSKLKEPIKYIRNE
jgi:hypothetical protein